VKPPFWVTIHTLVSGFVICSLVDVALTIYLLATGDFFEVNPIASEVYRLWGNYGLLTYKATAVSFLVLIFYKLHDLSPKTAKYLLIGANLFMGSVVFYSLGLLTQFLISW
jgi:hypothetical protein